MFRMEIDALNAIYAEQRRTNELLEKLLERGISYERMYQDAEGHVENSLGSELDLLGEVLQNGAIQRGKGTGSGRRKRIG